MTEYFCVRRTNENTWILLWQKELFITRQMSLNEYCENFQVIVFVLFFAKPFCAMEFEINVKK